MLRLKTLLTLCLLFIPLLAKSERYSVEEDSFGGYSAKRVIQDESAIDDSELEGEAESVDQGELESDQPISATEPSSKKTLPKDKYIGEIGEKLSPFEKAYIESEIREREKILKRIKEAPKLKSDFDATQINPEEYIDGEALLRGEKGSAYYSLVDVDGTIRNVSYDREEVQEALRAASESKIELTEASVLKRSEPLELPENADPFAAMLLSNNGSSNDYFTQFSEKCCDNMPSIDIAELELGKYFYFEFDERQLPYRFAGGDSRFLLLRIPTAKVPQILKMRTFIREHKMKGIENGVFFPQLVTLDKDKKPLRIFTGPLLNYHAETWLDHGYLEGFFQIDATENGAEEYLLVNTTREILKQDSSIEDREGLTTIEHMEIGTIELTLLPEEG